MDAEGIQSAFSRKIRIWGRRTGMVAAFRTKVSGTAQQPCAFLQG